MKTTLLIGAEHTREPNAQGALTLLSKESDIDFFNKYSSVIDTRNTLLIVEGGYSDRVMQPSHKFYNDKMELISPLLLKNKLTPDLLFADYRYCMLKNNEIRYYAQLHRIQVFLQQSLAGGKINSLLELKDAVFDNNYTSSFRSAPDTLVKDAAKSALVVNKETNRQFANAFRSWKDRYQNVFLITGSAHTLCIAKEHLWDYEIMSSSFGSGQEHFTVIASGYYFFNEEGLKSISTYK